MNPGSLLVNAGRSEVFVCPDCGNAHRVQFSLPEPGSLKIGLRITRDEKATEEARAEIARKAVGGGA
jgi:hypothetical protein